MPTSTTEFRRIRPSSEERHRAIAYDWPIAAERRSKIRYPLGLHVRFRCLSGDSFFSGAGRAINVSSGGVLVVSQHLVSQHNIRVGACTEMNIEWPVLLDGKIALQLQVVGRVVRCGVPYFAAAIKRYQFRTMRSS
jgi:hypothetical protein